MLLVVVVVVVVGVGVDPVHGSQQTGSCVLCSLCDLNGTDPNDSV